ncbi:uncharacterized protein LOC115999793 [Ipomoea triloba]|uniref:uncharacterized protein LOC115999793 n=1 Tax=Ipomoea triloba TaxID=35885 RepID=UPI00125E860C|nr:uncharacterized protein LOC115999793 [Ipomoea triloba]
MGKVDDEQSLPTAAVRQQGSGSNAANNRCCCSSRFRLWVSFRCVFALLLSLAVFISAVFLLPFFRSSNPGPPDPDSRFGGYDIVARFMLDKPDWFLEDYILQLEDDIFDEINVAQTKVDIISFETSAGSNTTTVIFAVDSDVKTLRVSPTAQSLVRANFESILVHQSNLRLTTASLFGDPISFDVLKFKGGITVSPTQSAFLMQNQQFHFNFTLNFSIKEIQDNFDELRGQLTSGLHLTAYENLYISLTNLRGSTIDPPTIVRSQVLLAVGINPSRSRMKQLAQTITGPHAKNLGLNNTVFGRVKQVSLSSNWTRLLGGPDAGSPSPSPAPLPHHSHHRDTNLAPAFSPSSKTGKSGHVSGEKSPSPTPTPAPVPSPHLHKIHQVKPPACPFGPKGTPPSKTHKQNHMAPPAYAPNAAPASSLKPHREAPTPSPHEVPTPSPSPSPLPNVVNARVHPPSGSNSDAEPPDKLRLVSHIPSSASTVLYSNLWALPPFLLALHL